MFNFAGSLFIETLYYDPVYYFLWIFLVLFSVCFHELMHGLFASWQGDKTASEMGYLTFDPIKQIGFMSMIFLCFFGLAWGATPVNPGRMKNKYSEALVAFAGPLGNLLLLVVFSFLTALFTWKIHTVYSELVMMFQIGAILNGALFIFNMLPIPSLDGWIVFSYILPGMKKTVPVTARFSMIIFFVLLLFFNVFLIVGTAANSWLVNGFGATIM